MKYFKKFFVIDFEHRQQMRDRWLHDAFAVGLPSPTNVTRRMSNNEHQISTGKNSIDEEEAVRLLSDHGISEDKAKVRLQVS